MMDPLSRLNGDKVMILITCVGAYATTAAARLLIENEASLPVKPALYRLKTQFFGLKDLFSKRFLSLFGNNLEQT